MFMPFKQPFENCLSFQISYKVASGYRPEFKIQLPKSYLNLIEKCWSQDPLDRPTFDQILDQLKNDRVFITEKVDEEEYQNYMSYIDSFTTSFDSSKRINLIKKYIGGKQKIYQNDDNVNVNSNLLNSINNICFFIFF